MQGVRDAFPRAHPPVGGLREDALASRCSSATAKRVPSFNDDIQGTAAVTLGGIFAALRITGQSIREQRVLCIESRRRGASASPASRKPRCAPREAGDDEYAPRDRRLRFPRASCAQGLEIPDAHKREFVAEQADPRPLPHRRELRRPWT